MPPLRFRTLLATISATVVTFLVSAVLSLLSVWENLTLWSKVGAIGAIFFGIVLSAISAFWGERQICIQQNKKLAAITDYLVDTIKALKVPGKARVGLYVIDSKKEELYLKYEHNMRGALDTRLRFRPSEGIVGYVWKLACDRQHDATLIIADFEKIVFVDPVAKEPTRINLSPDMLDLIQSEGVKAVLCVPVYDNSVDIINRKVIGVLNVDSDQPVSTTTFNSKEYHSIANLAAGSLGRYLSTHELV